MKLNLVERLVLLGLLPDKGDFVTLKIFNDLRHNVGFSEEELEEYGLRLEKTEQGGRYVWHPEANKIEVEVPIGARAVSIIADLLKNLDKTKSLTNLHVSLYEKFVEKDGTDG